MSDVWTPDEQLVGRWDGDARLFVVTGWTYGPAGPARVALAPGLTLGVDFANPTVTNEITIEAALSGDPSALDPRVERAAAALLGRTALGRLLALGRGGPRHHSVRITDELGWQPTAGVRQEALARFVLLAEIASDPDLGELNAAVAGLEAAGVASVADRRLTVLGGAAAALASDAAGILLGVVGRGSFRVADPHVADELAAVIRHALRVVDDDLLARRLRHFADDLDRGSFRAEPPVAASLAPAAATAAPAVPAGRPAKERRRAAAAAARPLRPERLEVDGPRGAIAEQTGPTEIEVWSPAHLENRWARVFRRHDLLLLALAPLRSRRGRHGALLVIPSGLRPGDLLVDITDQPEAPRPSDPLVRVRAAVAAGRDACRHERTGDERLAAQRWAACAEQWAAAGDRERADTAARYSSGDRSDPRLGAGRRNARRGGPVPQGAFLADRAGLQ